MNDINQEVESYLSEIATLSEQGDIPWIRSTSSAYSWEKKIEGSLCITTIQQATSIAGMAAKLGINPHHKKNIDTISDLTAAADSSVYLFQVKKKEKNETILSISSSDSPDYQGLLRKIYNGAKKGQAILASNTLKKLLGK